MDKTIEIAKCVLADMFDFRKDEFDRKITRKRNVTEARRFLIYFLIDELKLKFSDIPKKMKCITSHATAMHHFYKMQNFMDLKHEKSTRIQYLEFKTMMVVKGMDRLENELKRQEELKHLCSINIEYLKKMLDDK